MKTMSRFPQDHGASRVSHICVVSVSEGGEKGFRVERGSEKRRPKKFRTLADRFKIQSELQKEQLPRKV